MSTFEYTMGVPAWKALPTWFVVAANDEAIPPDAERQFAARLGRRRSRSPRATWRWSPMPTRWSG
jgi:hypothetical protein